MVQTEWKPRQGVVKADCVFVVICIEFQSFPSKSSLFLIRVRHGGQTSPGFKRTSLDGRPDEIERCEGCVGLV